VPLISREQLGLFEIALMSLASGRPTQLQAIDAEARLQASVRLFDSHLSSLVFCSVFANALLLLIKLACGIVGNIQYLPYLPRCYR
jgi:hypothetical protein